jgi:hypothetical protein
MLVLVALWSLTSEVESKAWLDRWSLKLSRNCGEVERIRRRDIDVVLRWESMDGGPTGSISDSVADAAVNMYVKGASSEKASFNLPIHSRIFRVVS